MKDLKSKTVPRSAMTATTRPAIRLVNHSPLPMPQAPRSRHHLSPEQVQFFDDHGYLVLKQWITGELLTRLQDAAHRWIALGEDLHQRGQLEGPDADLGGGFQLRQTRER
ncbi:MAG: hypothetical protein HC933_15285 [Pleurocapsa sp. SU_196_0]|nr:hypothetical protein [Pleurocapsa sp. SU_196_0]